jgi:hypothetical protein
MPLTENNEKWLKIRRAAAGSSVVLLFLTFFSILFPAASLPGSRVGVIIFLTIFGLFVAAILIWLTAAVLSSTVQYSLLKLALAYVFIAACIGAIVRYDGPGQAFGLLGLCVAVLGFAIHRYLLHAKQQFDEKNSARERLLK